MCVFKVPPKNTFVYLSKITKTKFYECWRESHFFTGSDKLFFVTSNPEDEAEASLAAMFKFLAAKETDIVKPVNIR